MVIAFQFDEGSDIQEFFSKSKAKPGAPAAQERLLTPERASVGGNAPSRYVGDIDCEVGIEPLILD